MLGWGVRGGRGHVSQEFSLCWRHALLMFSLITLNKTQGDLDHYQDSRLEHSEGVGSKRG